MKDIELLLQEINENPQVIADVDWKEATNEFSQSTLERLMEGIADVEVMKDVAELIKDRHRIAVKDMDACCFEQYAPDCTWTGDDGVTVLHPRAGQPDWDNPKTYWRKERVDYHNGSKPLLENIIYDIYDFLDKQVKDIEENREREQRKKSIREKYTKKSVACCNATHKSSETTDGEDTNKGVASATCNAGDVSDECIRATIDRMIRDKILKKKQDFAWVMCAMHSELQKSFDYESFPVYLREIGIPETQGKVIGCPSAETLRRLKAEYEANFSKEVDEWKYPEDNLPHAQEVYRKFVEYIGLK